jgi:hypothetical protein
MVRIQLIVWTLFEGRYDRRDVGWRSGRGGKRLRPFGGILAINVFAFGIEGEVWV